MSNEEKELKEWEATKIVTAYGETIADLRKIFEAVQGEHWKDPFDAYVPVYIVGSLCRAIEFFHGRKANVSKKSSSRKSSCIE